MRSSDRVRVRITPLDVLGNPDESRSVETFGQFKMELSTEPQDPPQWIHGQTPDGGEVWLRADLFTETAPGEFTTGAHPWWETLSVPDASPPMIAGEPTPPVSSGCDSVAHDGQGTIIARCDRPAGHDEISHVGSHATTGDIVEWRDFQ